jgi:predicted glycogen debranching enzyme
MTPFTASLLDPDRDAAAPAVPGDAIAQETYGEFRPHIRREWLLTNGLGGYAGGTVLNVNTRRYHGLLVTATLPPVGRVVAVSRVGETLMIDGRAHNTAGAYFRNELTGDGPKLLRRFRLEDETATWEYDIGGTKLFREIFVCWHRNAAAVTWRVVPAQWHRSVSLHLSPFAALRDFHGLLHSAESEFRSEADGLTTRVHRRDLGIEIRGVGDTQRLRFDAAPDWWFAHSYPMETARGLEDREDLFSPGTFSLQADGEQSVTLWLQSTEEPAELDLEQERARRAQMMDLRPMPTPAQRRLVRAAADFVVRRRRPDGMPGTTILAGYPWFSDWGRATFIALPGLLLTTGRKQVAGQVLSTFAHFVDRGMVPNRFDEDTNDPSYAAADASLWFIDAAHAYLRATKDRDIYESILRPACEAIVDGYRNGTRFGIRVDPDDGLVTAGEGNPPLTWMDGRTIEQPATPRAGKPVEINALWHNALRLLGHDADADVVAGSFGNAFKLGQGRGLADVVVGGPGTYEHDDRLRPNQIMAVSLAFSPLPTELQHEVVDVVRRTLLTPLGLRSLAPGSPAYVSRFTGGWNLRGHAYHNGPIWPWLMGPFLTAHLRINEHSDAARSRARVWLKPLLDHLFDDGCLGGISELFDSEWPYRPGGCVHHACAVAEALRLAVELDL